NIFDGGAWKGITDIPSENIYAESVYKFSQRTFKLTYSQSFGNKKLNAKRDRTSASEEEQRRVN
ncbi:MAG: hypothetical protein JJE22_15260, partial [Bacteroidia bacterium]|nr:hypothetical protein [Bacteroidia bacterium]